MHNKKAIIIGSGVGGLATAVRLAVMGLEVEVFEKNAFPGGKLHAFEKNGFQFDAGPSLFTQPQNIEELFTLAGEPIENYFTYRQVSVACKYFYENGRSITAYSDIKAFDTELVTRCSEKPGALQRYLGKAQKAYRNIATVFLNYSLHQFKTWWHKRILGALGTVKPSYLFSTLDKYNRSNFQSPEAVQLFNRYATYNGSNPFKAPGMLSLIPHLEMNEGVFYPQGGMISITRALFRLAEKKGVKFHFNSKVERIHHDHGKVAGITVNGQQLQADIVISNVDVYFTYAHLLQDGKKAARVLRQERSSSAFIFYWGINRSFPQLHLHNIFFSSNYAREFEGIFETHTLYADPTVYVNVTSKMEDGQAPAGQENWFVMINVPAGYGKKEPVDIDQVRNLITVKLSRILQEDIATHIVTEEILSPALIEAQTASYLGSLYGTSSNSPLAAFLRHPNFSKSIQGLYFCGGSVHPGGGIPLCLKSGKIVCDLVEKDIQKRRI